MWRRTTTTRCLAHDLATGVPSDYRPRYRPRRLVMPVDTWQRHSKKRNVNPEYSHYRQQIALAKSVRKKGALKLSTVPVERTAADAVRLALENAERSGLTEVDSVLPAEGKSLLKKLRSAADLSMKENGSVVRTEMLQSAPEQVHLQVDITSVGTSVSRGANRDHELQQRGLTVWGLLEKTTMDAPAHGFLSLLGKSLVERTILEMLYERYPRMRSQHAQRMIHQSTGLFSIGRMATQLGLVDIYGIQTEVGLWREMNVLRDRLRIGRQMATLHKERMALGIGAQKRWYWRNVLKSAGRKLKRLPVHEKDLRPRMEWLRDHVFQFVAAVEAMEGSHKATMLIKRLFCSQLLRFHVCQELVQQVNERRINGSFADDGALIDDAHAEVKKLITTMLDDSWSNTMHPLHARGLEIREAMESSGGAHAVHPLKEQGAHSTDRMKHLAPKPVADLVESQHAFREAQIVLRYAPFVAPELRDAPIDVDIVVRSQVEVDEMNLLHSLVQAQQFQQVQYRVARLFAGDYCIGEGKGESDIEAMQMAATHMLQHYYLRQFPVTDSQPDGETEETQAEQDAPLEQEPRIRSFVSQSTVSL